MTSRTYLMTAPDSVDSIEAATFGQRLEQALATMSGLVAGAPRLLFPQPASSPNQTPGVVRHRTYYGPTPDAAKSIDTSSLRVQVDYSQPHQCDLLTIDFVPRYDLLGLRLVEPVGPADFNQLAPAAPIEQVAAIVARWRDWMSRIVLPISYGLRDEMDRDLAQSQDAIFERLRIDGYDHPMARAGLFALDFNAPYRPPEVTWTETIGLMSGPPHQCFTNEGRAMLAEALPTLLAFSHCRLDKGVELTLHPYRIAGQSMGEEPSIVEQLKLLRRLPKEDGQPHVLPFEAELQH